MSDIPWQPEDLAGHAPYCAHPHHSLAFRCAADADDPNAMRGLPSQAWRRDHPDAGPQPGPLSCLICGHIGQSEYRHPTSDHEGHGPIIVVRDAAGDEHWFQVAGDDDDLMVTVDRVPVLGVDRHGPGYWPDGETWVRLESQDDAGSVTETCGCCDVYDYRDRPPDDECPRCGHYYRRHNNGE